jgi:hypothetical protein
MHCKNWAIVNYEVIAVILVDLDIFYKAIVLLIMKSI